MDLREATARRWTLADLVDLPEGPERYEVVDGLLVVSPGPTRWHQAVGTELLLQLGGACQGTAWQAVYETAFDYVGDASGDARVPDLLVVRREALRRTGSPGYVAGEIGLLVEVVSPSSRRRDRFHKPAEYADQGVALLWRVELEPEVAVHTSRLVDGGWQAGPVVTERAEVDVPWGRMVLDVTPLHEG